MGPTKVFRAQFDAPTSIRSEFGLSDTRNATHGSDSEVSAEREIAIFFPDFNKNDGCNDWKLSEWNSDMIKMSCCGLT